MPRFLHTADWQIGRQFATFPPEDAQPLAQARIAAVERITALAVEHAVDAVLVAGDVFEMQTVDERTLRRVFNAMAGFAGAWVLIPGNHDAALSESVWTRAQRLGVVPAQVSLALTPDPVLLQVARMAILPAPLQQRHTWADTTAWFDTAETPDGFVRIGIAHGAVQGILPQDIDSPNPIAPDRAATARLDYLALGDWHGCKRIDARTWYSGTPEPDRFRSVDAGQLLLVDIAAPGEEPRVQALPVARHAWLSLQGALQVPSDIDELITRLAALPTDAVVELQLDGQIDLAGQQRLDAALNEAHARLRHLGVQREGLVMMPTDADIAGLRADGYLGEVIAELRDMQQGGETEDAHTARDALALLSGMLVRRAAA